MIKYFSNLVKKVNKEIFIYLCFMLLVEENIFLKLVFILLYKYIDSLLIYK